MEELLVNSHDDLPERAAKCFPGGVTAAARLNKVTREVFRISRAAGSRLFDRAGRPYIDMCVSYGASLLGHGHPKVVEALSRSGNFGLGCAMEFEEQVKLAEHLIRSVPSAEMVRFTLSGTETTQYAVKLARVYTRKRKIIKIEGHFHGYNDYLQFNYWPATGQELPNVYPETAGVPGESIHDVIVVPFNDLPAIEQACEKNNDIAAVILEPVNFNSGGIRPKKGYLQKLRKLTEEKGILLIFDEILSGFRTGPDCMQGYYGVTPDITTLGKAIGGGTPLSAFVGSREVMSAVTPLGDMMHSGTYNAHSVNMFCGLAFMEAIQEKDFYPVLLSRSAHLYDSLNDVFRSMDFPALAHGLGARFGLLFGSAAECEPEKYRDVQMQDWSLAHRFFAAMKAEGVYFNNGWHHGISIAHSDEDIGMIVNAAETAVKRIVKSEY